MSETDKMTQAQEMGITFTKAKCAFCIIVGENGELVTLPNVRPQIQGIEYEQEEAKSMDVEYAIAKMSNGAVAAAVAKELVPIIRTVSLGNGAGLHTIEEINASKNKN